MKLAQDNIKIAQGQQKRFHDKRHRPQRTLEVGDKVFILLDKHPVKALPSSKLAWPKWGPFEILEKDSHTVTLDLPKSSQINKRVSINQVEKTDADPFDREDAPPTRIDGDRKSVV